MSIPKMANAMGYIDDDLVSGAVEYKRTKKKNSWLKWGAMAACLCLVVVGAFGGVHSHTKQYVISNNISVYHAGEYSDRLSSDDVTPEQADRLEVANNIHNILSAQNYEWYGSCYYDFEADKIMVGLTEVSDDNKETVLTRTGDTAVQFYECDYSYQYLEELYNKLDSKRTVLSVLGVERFNISIEKNRVNVRIGNAKNYEAIYMANELDHIGGAIVFTSDNITADRS